MAAAFRHAGDRQLQLLRPDRVHGRRAVVPGGRGGPAGRRASAAQPTGLRARRCVASGTRGSTGGVVPGWTADRPRLPEPAGPDRATVRGLSVRPRRRADVPDRGTGTVAARRPAGVSRTYRRPGEDPRVPDRAG